MSNIFRAPGTFLSVAYDDWRNTNARKVAFIEAADDAAAVAAFIAAAGGGLEYGQGASTGDIPLARVTASFWGKSAAASPGNVYRVVADYSPKAIGPTSSSAAVALATFDAASEQVPYYSRLGASIVGEGTQDFDAYGFPVGPANTPSLRNLSFRPIARLMNRPTVRIEVPTVLTSNPLAIIGDRLMTVNADPFTIAGFTFGAHVLRLDAARIRPTNSGTPGPIKWQVWYVFMAAAKGWYGQLPDFRKDQNESFPTWKVDTQLSHPSKSFATPAFPYGT